jgi:zinc and cadmium transporter
MEMLTPLFYASLAGGATLIGLALTLRMRKFVSRYSFAIVSLAAGIMLGTAFLHVLPEAEDLIGHDSGLWLLIGFGAFYIIESLLGSHCCDESSHNHNHALGKIAGVGIFFHSLLDGMAIAVGYEVSPALGLITAIAVIAHELPEGIFTLTILLHSGMTKKKAIWWTVLVAIATPIGAILTLLLLPNLNEYALGLLLAVTAGSFIYIAAADLVPESHRSRSLTTAAFVILGLLMMFAINSVTGHEHIH